jgi:hypothetical protein
MKGVLQPRVVRTAEFSKSKGKFVPELNSARHNDDDISLAYISTTP